MNNDDDIFQSDNKYQDFKFLQRKTKPLTSLDYLFFHSDEYLNFKKKDNIQKMISCLDLSENIQNTIVETSQNMIKKVKKFSQENDIKTPREKEIVQIVTYKTIKKNRIKIPISILIKKMNFDKSKYLKFNSQVNIIDSKEGLNQNKKNNLTNNFSEIQNIKDFYEKLLEQVSYIISGIADYIKKNPNEFKFQYKNETLYDIGKLLNSSEINKKSKGDDSDLFLDKLKLLNEIKNACNNFINYDLNQNNFHQILIELYFSMILLIYLFIKIKY